MPQSLQTQLVWFNKILENEGCKDSHITPRECKAVLGDALIWLGEIGANDYTSSLGSSISRKSIRTLAIKSVAGFLQVNLILLDLVIIYILIHFELTPLGFPCTRLAARLELLAIYRSHPISYF